MDEKTGVVLMDEKTCQCGSVPGEIFEAEPIVLRECPYCFRFKCERCDMGDDVPCIGCENA